MLFKRLTLGRFALGKYSGRETSRTWWSRGLLSAGDTHTQTDHFHSYSLVRVGLIRGHKMCSRFVMDSVPPSSPAAWLTGAVCGFESLLSFGQEAIVGPVQHGLDLVLWVVRLAGRKRLLRPGTGHLRQRCCTE